MKKIKIKQTYLKKKTADPIMTIQGTGNNYLKRSHSLLEKFQSIYTKAKPRCRKYFRKEE